MARTMRSAADAAANYQSGTSNRAHYWQLRAESANWQAGAGSDAAEANYATKVQAAIAAKSRKNAIMQTPNSVYTSGITASAGRYSQGTQAAHAKMNSFFNKLMPDIAQHVQALPARGPRGSQSNIMQRGTQIQTKLAASAGKYKVRGVAKSVGGV